MNPGGPDSSEPELDPGTVSGRLAACTRRERGEDGGEHFSVALKTRILGGRGRGTVFGPVGPIVVPTFPAHTPGNYVFLTAVVTTKAVPPSLI